MVPRPALLLCLSAPIVVWIGVSSLLAEGALRVRSWEPIARSIRPNPPGAPASGEEVEVTAADGVVLRATFLESSGSAKCILILHGIADSRSAGLGLAPLFFGAGYSVLAADLRGHGTSGGDRITYGVLEKDDALRWAAWLRTRGCEQVDGYGASLGGAVLIQAASQAPAFHAIVAECSYRDLRSVAEDRLVQRLFVPEALSRPIARALIDTGFAYAQMRHRVDLREASPEDAGRHLQTRLLLIHGLDDAETPPSHSLAIAAATPGAELWLVPGAKHVSAYATTPAEFRGRVLSWLEASPRLQ